MINYCFTFIFLFHLISCGFNVKFNGAELLGTSGFAQSDSGAGTEVGRVTLSGECSSKEYSLENDYNGYFSVDKNGIIKLAKDNPPPKTYKIIVIGKCGSQEEKITIPIVIKAIEVSIQPCDSSQRLQNITQANYMRGYHGSVKLNENEIMFIGGNWRDTPGAETPEIYNVQNDSFTPVAQNLMPRFASSILKMKDGRIMVIAGSASGSGPGADSLVEIYDQQADTWTQVESIKFPRWWGASLLLKSGKIVYIGGSGTKYLEIFDPDTNSWTTLASMNIARQGFKIIEKDNGNIVAFGGYNQATYSSVNSVEEYDFATNTWSLITSMQTSRSEYELVKKENKVFLIAGSGVSGSNVEIYDLNTNTSTLIDPIGSTYTLVAGVLSNGNIVVTGGINYPVYVLNINTLQWTNVLTIPGNYRASTMQVLEDDSIVMMGGVSSGGIIHANGVRVCLSNL